MENILSLLFKKHYLWLDYIKSFGCKDETSEDFVQEMYIKIFVYIQKNGNDIMYNDTEVNYFFVYVTLKNMWYDYARLKKRIVTVDLSDDYIQDETEYSEIIFNVQNDAMIVWRDNLIEQIENIPTYTRTKANLCYVKFIFDKVFVEQIKVAQLSRDVGITYWSLRHTVLLIKQQIKEI